MSKNDPLPDSLREIRRKRKPCAFCGKMTVGAEYDPRVRLNLDGSIAPEPEHLCAECAPTSSIKRQGAAYGREREAESRASGRKSGRGVS